MALPPDLGSLHTQLHKDAGLVRVWIEEHLDNVEHVDVGDPSQPMGYLLDLQEKLLSARNLVNDATALQREYNRLNELTILNNNGLRAATSALKEAKDVAIRTELDGLTREIASLKREVSAYTGTISTLQDQLAGRPSNAEITSLNSKIADLKLELINRPEQKTVADLTQTISSRDKQTLDLESQISQLSIGPQQTEIARLKDEISSRDRQISTLETQVGGTATLNEELKALREYKLSTEATFAANEAYDTEIKKLQIAIRGRQIESPPPLAITLTNIGNKLEAAATTAASAAIDTLVKALPDLISKSSRGLALPADLASLAEKSVLDSVKSAVHLLASQDGMAQLVTSLETLMDAATIQKLVRDTVLGPKGLNKILEQIAASTMGPEGSLNPHSSVIPIQQQLELQINSLPTLSTMRTQFNLGFQEVLKSPVFMHPIIAAIDDVNPAATLIQIFHLAQQLPTKQDLAGMNFDGLDALFKSLTELIASNKTPAWLEPIKSELTASGKFLKSLPTRDEVTKYLEPFTQISSSVAALPAASAIFLAVAREDRTTDGSGRSQDVTTYASPEAIKALKRVLAILSRMPPEEEMLRFLEKLRKVPQMEQTVIDIGERASEMDDRLKADASEVDRVGMKQITDTLDLVKTLANKVDNIPAFPTEEDTMIALQSVDTWKTLLELLDSTLGSINDTNITLSKLEKSFAAQDLSEEDILTALRSLPNIEGVKSAITETMADIRLSPQQLDILAKQVALSLARSVDWKFEFTATLAEMLKDVPSRGPEGKEDSFRPSSALSGPGRYGDDAIRMTTADFWNESAHTINVIGPDAAMKEFVTFKSKMPSKEDFDGSDYDSGLHAVVSAVSPLFQSQMKAIPTFEMLSKYVRSPTYKLSVTDFVTYSRGPSEIADQLLDTAVIAPNTIRLLLHFLSNHLGMHIQMGMLEYNIGPGDQEDDFVSCSLVEPIMGAAPQATAWLTRFSYNGKPSALWSGFKHKTVHRRGMSFDQPNKRPALGSPYALTPSESRMNLRSPSPLAMAQPRTLTTPRPESRRSMQEMRPMVFGVGTDSRATTGGGTLTRKRSNVGLSSQLPPRRIPTSTPTDTVAGGKKRGVFSSTKTAFTNAGRSVSGGTRSISALVKAPGTASHSHGRGEVIRTTDANFDITKIPISLRHAFSSDPIQRGILAINADKNSSGLVCCLQTQIDGVAPKTWDYKDAACGVCRLQPNTVCVVMIDATTVLIKPASALGPTIRVGGLTVGNEDGRNPARRPRTEQDTPASWAAALRDRRHGQIVDIGLPGDADVAGLRDQGLDASSIKHLTGKSKEGQTKLRTGIVNLKGGVQKCLATTALGTRKGEFDANWPDAFDRCNECISKSRQCVMILDERTGLIKGQRV